MNEIELPLLNNEYSISNNDCDDLLVKFQPTIYMDKYENYRCMDPNAYLERNAKEFINIMTTHIECRDNKKYLFYYIFFDKMSKINKNNEPTLRKVFNGKNCNKPYYEEYPKFFTHKFTAPLDIVEIIIELDNEDVLFSVSISDFSSISDFAEFRCKLTRLFNVITDNINNVNIYISQNQHKTSLIKPLFANMEIVNFNLNTMCSYILNKSVPNSFLGFPERFKENFSIGYKNKDTPWWKKILCIKNDTQNNVEKKML